MAEKGHPEDEKYAKLFKILSDNPKITWSELKKLKLVTTKELDDLSRKGYVLVVRETSYTALRPKEDFEELDHVAHEVKEDQLKLRKS